MGLKTPKRGQTVTGFNVSSSFLWYFFFYHFFYVIFFLFRSFSLWTLEEAEEAEKEEEEEEAMAVHPSAIHSPKNFKMEKRHMTFGNQ